MAATNLPRQNRQGIFFIPLWQANLIFFIILFLLTVSYFIYQINNSQRLYAQDAKQHARLVAGVLALHIKGALLSRNIIEKNMIHFLGNTARFVAYLDSIEPFTDAELENFAEESGLVGIYIIRANGDIVQGPNGWMPREAKPDQIPLGGLKHYEKEHILIYRSNKTEPLKEILIGVDAFGLEELRKKIGLKNVIADAEKLYGINYIKLDQRPDPAYFASEKQPIKITSDAAVIFKNSPHGLTAEVIMPFGKGHLIVGLDATPLLENKKRLWRDFKIFAFVLALVGGILSYLLFRQQLSHMEDARRYERKLAKQREEASLGRSAAAIAHEIRNPLNAMSIALQRLKVEATELKPEHKQLITIILDSLKRTNKIIEGLLNYAKLTKHIVKDSVDFSNLILEVLSLYKGKIEGNKIVLHKNIEPDIIVEGDRTLLTQLLQNILLNAIEAQPKGGTIFIELSRQSNVAVLEMRNPGDLPSQEEMDKIFSPYFTLKTRGTGLGLAIIEKIVKAHNGIVKANIIDDREFQLIIQLPVRSK